MVESFRLKQIVKNSIQKRFKQMGVQSITKTSFVYLTNEPNPKHTPRFPSPS